jgi:hypothetical protein
MEDSGLRGLTHLTKVAVLPLALMDEVGQLRGQQLRGHLGCPGI